VTTLARRAQTIELEPAQIANGAVELLGEVSKSKITGEEERYSHLDLVDFQANVDGARAAFTAVRPILAARQAALARQIDQRFADVDAALRPYRQGSGFLSYAPFTGAIQAGISTPAQDRLHFAAFDLTTNDRRDLRDLLRAWADAAATMCAGKTVGQMPGDPAAPPEDTGEALGLHPARLTITFGFGPALFSDDGHDRFGLASARPTRLVDLPAFAGDELDPDRSGGDLAVQACADDPQVVFHAVRNLGRIGRGTVVMRWS
jgi:hypothetical protein